MEEINMLYTALDKMFGPKSIAVVGASSNMQNMGSRSLRLITDFGYDGDLYVVNPKAEKCYGADGYRKISDIDGPIDFCIIAVPAEHVLDVIRDCVKMGVPVAQILTSGIGDITINGSRMEEKILEMASGKMRIVGPNCVGTYSALGKLTFVADSGRQVGKVAICSQSGGLSIELVLKAKNIGLPLSKLVSMGNGIDVNPADFLRYFSQDPETDVIGLYLEGIDRGREFISVLKQVTRRKPVVILKGGRSKLGSEFAASHTDSLAGDYAIWQTAVKQAGAMSVEDIDEFLACLSALQSSVPRPQGKGLAIAGNGGGATVLATDVLAGSDLTLATLDDETKRDMSESYLPAGASLSGASIDIPANALYKGSGDTLGQMFNRLLGDCGVSGLIIHFNLLSFISYDNPELLVEGICSAIDDLSGSSKPIYISLKAISNPKIENFRQSILNAMQKAQLPCFRSPQEAIHTMDKVYQMENNNDNKSDASIEKPFESILSEATSLINEALKEGYKSLPQKMAYQIMDLFGIPHLSVRLVQRVEDAVLAAKEMGYPVVLKIDSPDIIHKTEAGGVRVGLRNEQELQDAFKAIQDSVYRYQPNATINGILVQKMSQKPILEMIGGLKNDPIFGKVLLVGMGGIWVEVANDVSMRVLPISRDDPGRMWRELTSASLLEGYRGTVKADTNALENLLLKVSAIGEFLPSISEMDLNPIMIMEEGNGVGIADCRIILNQFDG